MFFIFWQIVSMRLFRFLKYSFLWVGNAADEEEEEDEDDGEEEMPVAGRLEIRVVEKVEPEILNNNVAARPRPAQRSKLPNLNLVGQNPAFRQKKNAPRPRMYFFYY